MWAMKVPFTKMQGAGNDFVVLDETQKRFNLTGSQYRFLADRHFGVGADQILSVRPSPGPEADFEYVIHNADGGEVEQCGNGARCFVRYVREKGLTHKAQIKVKVQGGIISLQEQADGRVTVDMGPPFWEAGRVPFDPRQAQALPVENDAAADSALWRLSLNSGQQAEVAVLSMGNPHAVLRVPDVDQAPVATWGPLIEHHGAFPRRVNVGFMQILTRNRIRLRVFERGAGETLACGTGACAAVVAGIRLGWLDSAVDVQAPGGLLTIAWGGSGTSVLMTGPAQTVFHSEIEIPE
jgi:diaminopimelate epimerase